MIINNIEFIKREGRYKNSNAWVGFYTVKDSKIIFSIRQEMTEKEIETAYDEFAYGFNDLETENGILYETKTTDKYKIKREAFITIEQLEIYLKEQSK